MKTFKYKNLSLDDAYRLFPDLAFVYNGVAEADAVNWLSSMRKNVAIPNTKEYVIDEAADKGAILAMKKERRKRFLKLREEEIQAKLELHQTFTTFCDVTFKRGDLRAVGDFADDDGKPVTFTKEQVAKFLNLVSLGIFSEAKASRKQEEKKSNNGKMPEV